jgi:hypothetical protein
MLVTFSLFYLSYHAEINLRALSPYLVLFRSVYRQCFAYAVVCTGAFDGLVCQFHETVGTVRSFSVAKPIVPLDSELPVCRLEIKYSKGPLQLTRQLAWLFHFCLVIDCDG